MSVWDDGARWYALQEPLERVVTLTGHTARVLLLGKPR